MSNILLAEDEQAVRSALIALLESEFHAVHAAENGKQVLEEYWRKVPDLLILDVMMPVKSGFDVCREIRASDTATPILFLSAKAEEFDKVFGLGLGADDYLAKPFGTREFLARVETLLRRRRLGTHRVDGSEAARMTFHVGRAFVNGFQHQFVTASGMSVALTSREFLLLRLLNAAAGRIVPKEEIFRTLWGPGAPMVSRTLEQHLYTLRRKTEGNGFSIQTVPRCGLCLEVDADALVSAAS